MILNLYARVQYLKYDLMAILSLYERCTEYIGINLALARHKIATLK